jgi:hypothetical protein
MNTTKFLIVLLETSLSVLAMLVQTYPLLGAGSDFKVVKLTPSPPIANYYISPAGNDSNSGQDAAHPWASPKHTVKCGDTISIAAGTYRNYFGSGQWGTVNNCPSAGGVYFAILICAGPYVSSCNMGNTNPVLIDKSNWALEGVTGCFNVSPKSGTLHHVALINDVASGCSTGGFETYGGSASADYVAYVGDIAWNSAQGSGYCYSGMSVYEPNNWDTNPGTHVFIAGNFSWSNIDGAGCYGGANSDGEGIILDDFGHTQDTDIPFTGQAVVEQNLFLGNGGQGMHVFHNTSAKIFEFNNTAYGNAQSTVNPATWLSDADDMFGSGPMTVTNNIMQSTLQHSANPGANGNVYAFGVFQSSNLTLDGNYIFGVAGRNLAIVFSPGFSVGTNTYATPNFVNPTIPGAPSCSTALTVTCMATVIANFTPQAAGAIPIGYHPPRACAPDAYYPVWLKGVVPDGLITKPCGY